MVISRTDSQINEWILTEELNIMRSELRELLSQAEYNEERFNILSANKAFTTVVPRYTSALIYEPPSERYFALRWEQDLRYEESHTTPLHTTPTCGAHVGVACSV
jgi:hypothetical protein